MFVVAVVVVMVVVVEVRALAKALEGHALEHRHPDRDVLRFDRHTVRGSSRTGERGGDSSATRRVCVRTLSLWFASRRFKTRESVTIIAPAARRTASRANRRTRTQVSVMTGDDRNGVLRTINYVVDAVFACDMLLQFFVGFWDPSLKAMCYDPVIIARRYASSWLAMDVVSIFPFDVRLIDRLIDRARATRGEQEGREWVERTRATNSESTSPRTHTTDGR